jgi:hypothetical protein
MFEGMATETAATNYLQPVFQNCGLAAAGRPVRERTGEGWRQVAGTVSPDRYRIVAADAELDVRRVLRPLATGR